MCKANEDDLRVLVGKQFVTVLNEDLVTYIDDWQEQNTIRADRKSDTLYKELLLQIKPDIKLVEKKERSDTKKAKNKDGPAMDGPRTAQGKVIEDKSSQGNSSQENLIEENSIYPSIQANLRDGETEENYKQMIAENIGLGNLLEIAATHDGYSKAETGMVNEIYDIICDMVIRPRDTVKIENAECPWKIVKSQFLKLRYVHIANILNRILSVKDSIKNMHGYLITTLYKESMSGTIGEQAEIHDDYLNFLRARPYAV